jgi:Lar family restriction alleviation protein
MTNETTASQPKSIGDDTQGEIRKVHHLKTDPEVFDAVARGAKTHEIRLNDRDFQVGDRLVLAETESTGGAMRSAPKLYPLVYTGRTESRIVSHIQTGYGLADGWCILSFRAPAAQASATIQAAPKTSFADYWWGARHERRTQEDHAKAAWDFAFKSTAPMVADPAGVAVPNSGLLPCPFCGGDVTVFGGHNNNPASVNCNDCDSYGPSMRGREAAVIAWNRRAAAPLVPVQTHQKFCTMNCSSGNLSCADCVTTAAFPPKD